MWVPSPLTGEGQGKGEFPPLSKLSPARGESFMGTLAIDYIFWVLILFGWDLGFEISLSEIASADFVSLAMTKRGCHCGEPRP
jgi:hypothetical protein